MGYNPWAYMGLYGLIYGQVGGWRVGECLGSMPWGTARLGPVGLLMRAVKK